MKSESLRISKLFQNGGDIHYMLPLFQREYTWDKAQWQTLLQDAISIHDEMRQEADGDEGSGTSSNGGTRVDVEHFFGSIVVINDGTRNGTVPAFQVVDGQQRLTSVSLMLCALERALNGSLGQLRKKIRRLLLNLDEDGEVHYKLLPTTKYGDQLAYTAILAGDNPLPNTESRIPAAFDYFHKELSSRIASASVSAERMFFVLTQAFQVVFIDLNRDESPYRIFESLNAKGKSLSQADLVRNYIAMRLSPGMQEKVFSGQWERIENLLQERREVGRSRLGELTAFLRHYLAMRTGVLCSEEHVYARFRDRAERDFSTEDAFAAEVGELRRFAEIYDKLLRPDGEASPDSRTLLKALNVLESATAYPLLMSAFESRVSGAVTESQWVGVLEALENYMTRRYLAGEATNYLNKLFPTLWQQVDKSDPAHSLITLLASKGYPSDSRLRQRLESKPLYDNSSLTRNRTTWVLERVNRFLSAGTGGHTVLSGSATIEHILPQSPTSDWIDELGPDAERVVRDYLHTLGNLTLVTADWNASLSNKSFSIKKQRLSSHGLRLNSDYFNSDISAWDEDAIKARTSWLCEKITDIWPEFNVKDEPEALATTAAANFHQECVSRISAATDVTFVKRGSTSYSSSDDTTRLVCAASKRYQRAGQAFYWYAFHPSQQEFLTARDQSFIAYGCGGPEKVVLLPFSNFLPYVSDMNTTSKDKRQYWHVHIYESTGGKLLLALTHGRRVDITEYLLGGAAK